MPAEIQSFGSNVLIITGGQSFTQSIQWSVLKRSLDELNIDVHLERVSGEPTPGQVDAIVAQYKKETIAVVIGIGGGSPLDAAKAVAALLPSGRSVMNYLEGVGKGITFSGPTIPFIAVPTTAGTGSEMTKNAVLSDTEQGFKKSFRDEQMTAQVAIIDSTLLESCPRPQLIANAMDAFTQLLESYTSTRSNPLTDALALSGIEHFLKGFNFHQEADLAGLDHLAYASMLSGLCLAQTGLGAVHGIASPLGAHYPIPHGVACGTLLAAVTEANITALQSRSPNDNALVRYANIGRMINPSTIHNAEALTKLINSLDHWTHKLNIPTLNSFGMVEEDVDKIASESGGNSMKTNPIELTQNELKTIIMQRLS
ncbi:iron-containing alcohol dehydrogenase [Reinekea marina]|uniref:iron-containing alcohol dehydrogenase n=1 Tax=Reinekea marina TaxID=1310421 RepID=UPI0025B41C9A|nr:iron-containing alcohol dehydrogenase [Reinekea marina]MDN3650734.1 iron-containing alcohol dehydrogenase [Reinekea marina]